MLHAKKVFVVFAVSVLFVQVNATPVAVSEITADLSSMSLECSDNTGVVFTEHAPETGLYSWSSYGSDNETFSGNGTFSSSVPGASSVAEVTDT